MRIIEYATDDITGKEISGNFVKGTRRGCRCNQISLKWQGKSSTGPEEPSITIPKRRVASLESSVGQCVIHSSGYGFAAAHCGNSLPPREVPQITGGVRLRPHEAQPRREISSGRQGWAFPHGCGGNAAGTQHDPERIEFQAVPSGSCCLLRRETSGVGLVTSLKKLPNAPLLPTAPDLLARRKDALHCNTKVKH